jgi:hypothetical protein
MFIVNELEVELCDEGSEDEGGGEMMRIEGGGGGEFIREGE